MHEFKRIDKGFSFEGISVTCHSISNQHDFGDIVRRRRGYDCCNLTKRLTHVLRILLVKKK